VSQATGNADRWQLLPRLSDDEYQALKRDVAAQGVLVPVVIDADSGEVIEGHHRVQAWTELRAEGVKVPDYPKQLQRFDSDDDRVAFVLAANLFRRHLSRPQRAEVVASLRHEGWSVRRIAEALGVGRSTVGDDIEGVRNRTPGGREPAVITGRDDKTYPARRPRPVIFVQSNRDARRAADALRSLDAGASGLIGLSRAEEQARIANLARARAVAADGPAQQSGEAWELRIGDFREVLADLVGEHPGAGLCRYVKRVGRRPARR